MCATRGYRGRLARHARDVKAAGWARRLPRPDQEDAMFVLGHRGVTVLQPARGSVRGRRRRRLRSQQLRRADRRGLCCRRRRRRTAGMSNYLKPDRGKEAAADLDRHLEPDPDSAAQAFKTRTEKSRTTAILKLAAARASIGFMTHVYHRGVSRGLRRAAWRWLVCRLRGATA